jgi:hypothetical protein
MWYVVIWSSLQLNPVQFLLVVILMCTNLSLVCCGVHYDSAVHGQTGLVKAD